MLQSGCTSRSAKYAAYLCDYVVAVIRHDTAYKQVWARLNGIGGLTITTTLDPKDQHAADHAVNYMMPPPPNGSNPGRNADTEVLIQPGTGDVRAIAIDRPYGNGKRHNTIDYAVGPQYDGSEGWQLGSTGKVWTMVTALEQGIPFGYSKHVTGTATVSGYTNCKGQVLAPWHLTNDQSELNPATYSLYTGTTDSINVFFAYLEQKVGLCNVIKTATQMGLTWPDGKSLLKPDRREHHLASADNDPSFTLGADNLAPIDVAASDATLPARGIYCSPIAITKIVTDTGLRLPVESAHCHRALSQAVADAANYILQGDLTSGTATVGPDRAAVGVQDRDRGLLRVGVLRGVHAAASGRGLDRQPRRQHRHDRHELLLPAGLSRFHVRVDGPGPHLADDIHGRASRQARARLRAPGPVQPAVLHGQRPVRHPAQAAQAAAPAGPAGGGGGGGGAVAAVAVAVAAAAVITATRPASSPAWSATAVLPGRGACGVVRGDAGLGRTCGAIGRSPGACLPAAPGPVPCPRRLDAVVLTAEPAADLGGDPGPLGPPRDPRGEDLHDLAHGARAARSGLLDRGRHQVA